MTLKYESARRKIRNNKNIRNKKNFDAEGKFDARGDDKLKFYFNETKSVHTNAYQDFVTTGNLNCQNSLLIMMENKL